MLRDTIRFVIQLNDSSSFHAINGHDSILMIKDNVEGSFLGLSESLWSHAILPFAIPFLLLGLGYLINIALVKWELRKQLVGRQDFLFTWIDLIGPQFHEQTMGLNSLVPNILQFESQLISFKVYPVHLDKLEIIDPVGLISLFITNKQGQTAYKTQLLYTLENSIDYLKSKTNRSLELIDAFVLDMQQADDAIEDQIEKLISQLEKIQERHSKEKQYRKLIRRFIEWKVDTDLTLAHFKAVHLDKLMKAWDRLMCDISPENCAELSSRRILHRLKNLYTIKQTKREKFATIFKDMAVELDNRYDDLLKAKQALATLRFRFFLFLK